MDFSINYSERNVPLVYTGKPKLPILTVENYMKWYDLYLVMPDGSVEPVFKSQLVDSFEISRQMSGSPYIDHVYNPEFVNLVAKALGAKVDEEAYEMIIGRWELEQKGTKYPPAYEPEE